MSSISIVHQKLQVEDARLVTVSDLVQDTDGKWLRIVKFYGDPTVNGAPTAFVEVAVRSSSKADLEIQAPGFKF
ncbi:MULTISPECIES: hypothetical protein [Bradyrhizobium]|jgi:hypothetical protein|uniref:Uncharacterized protein n=2 Tax=Bradyrhizobium TaxID=374 RepID=A0A810CX79_9BRAD|nr:MULTISPECIES: hypothetical protein [Bradyrhizobium]BCE22179.1 hypothetical protein XF1B_48600 [Bradyrhizobium diazoefficiens]MBP1297109.1 hypothetical protein [Bradyrhizobium elkanii]MCP1932129.1 hypothetical protein [Bradyrhizobium elkanii]MCS3577329.1 hypothetical protein [Bradyrhizobium elkanii]MCS3720205.1 hypothetical protein [Bradyrhizobium elkanii]